MIPIDAAIDRWLPVDCPRLNGPRGMVGLWSCRTPCGRRHCNQIVCLYTIIVRRRADCWSRPSPSQCISRSHILQAMRRTISPVSFAGKQSVLVRRCQHYLHRDCNLLGIIRTLLWTNRNWNWNEAVTCWTMNRKMTQNWDEEGCFFFLLYRE